VSERTTNRLDLFPLDGDGRIGRLGEGVGVDRELLGQLTAAEDLGHPVIVDEPDGAKRLGVDHVDLEGFEVLAVDEDVLDAERVREAPLRHAPLDGHLPTL